MTSETFIPAIFQLFDPVRKVIVSEVKSAKYSFASWIFDSQKTMFYERTKIMMPNT